LREHRASFADGNDLQRPAKIGPPSVKFDGKVLLSDMDRSNSYRIPGEGQGGAAGFVKGGADVRGSRNANAARC
jgi:carbon monoxide dehydrogenase subunit G